jgi:hypothetical protein
MPDQPPLPPPYWQQRSRSLHHKTFKDCDSHDESITYVEVGVIFVPRNRSAFYNLFPTEKAGFGRAFASDSTGNIEKPQQVAIRVCTCSRPKLYDFSDLLNRSCCENPEIEPRAWANGEPQPSCANCGMYQHSPLRRHRRTFKKLALRGYKKIAKCLRRAAAIVAHSPTPHNVIHGR